MNSSVLQGRCETRPIEREREKENERKRKGESERKLAKKKLCKIANEIILMMSNHSHLFTNESSTFTIK